MPGLSLDGRLVAFVLKLREARPGDKAALCSDAKAAGQVTYSQFSAAGFGRSVTPQRIGVRLSNTVV